MSTQVLTRAGSVSTPTSAPRAQVLPTTGVPHDPYRGRRTERAVRTNVVKGFAVASVVMVFVLYFAGRGLSGWGTMKDALKSTGIILGLVSADLLCLMTLLAARIPFVDKAMGHDRAIARHGGLGTWAVGAVLAHGVLVTMSYAMSQQTSFIGQFTRLWSWGDYALAVTSFGLLVLVGITSALLSVRKHLPHQLWHAIHLSTYAAIALSIPHQFSMDKLFDATWAKAYWIGFYALTAAAMLVFRVVVPVVRSVRHSLVVSEVHHESDDVVTITMTGEYLGQLDAQAGQFFNWRFWTPGLVLEQHPFSISAAPNGTSLRITVRRLGAGTDRITRIQPGTRVSFEGPYGIFSDAARTRQAVVLAGSGVGIAPIRAVVEATQTIPGRSLVLLRATTAEELYHLDEFRQICRSRGIQLVTLVGRRAADGAWTTEDHPHLKLVQLAPWIADADLYVCGPDAWSTAVVAEAEAYGVHPSQVHRESFSM